MVNESYYVYILVNWNGKVMYIGMTSDLKRRLKEHSKASGTGFTHKYNVNKLVYFEKIAGGREESLRRERQIKEWKRSWKNDLVESLNPTWRDLSGTL